MLRYLGAGKRQFGLTPMYVHRRANWEFFAVVAGRCAPVGVSDQPVYRTRHLWLFPPDSAHGWAGLGASSCTVLVFHFGSVPPVLDRAARRAGFLEHHLTATQATHLRKLVAELQPYYRRVTEKGLLVFERARLELSLMMVGEGEEVEESVQADATLRKVEASLAWFAEHMPERPKIEAVARSVHVSVRHLRRIFQETRHESPHQAMVRLRIHRALELLAHTALKLDEVARACGFASSSDFCRVFQLHQRVSPGTWRRHMLKPYGESTAAAQKKTAVRRRGRKA